MREDSELDYDPDLDPDRGAWLGADEPTRLAAVERGHPPVEEGGTRARLHLALHAVVETQVAQDDPSAVGDALARLQSQGLTRHEAIHAIASVVTEHMVLVLDSTEPFDSVRYIRDLSRLSGADWKGTAPARKVGR